MRNWKIYLYIFIAQILVGVNAGASFALIPSRYLAALWAGTAFLLLGLGVIWSIFKIRRWKSALLWVALVHVVIFSIPLLGSRILDSTTPFDQMTFWGVTGPEFHMLSTKFYGFFILIAVIEGLLVFKNRNQEPYTA